MCNNSISFLRRGEVQRIVDIQSKTGWVSVIDCCCFCCCCCWWWWWWWWWWVVTLPYVMCMVSQYLLNCGFCCVVVASELWPLPSPVNVFGRAWYTENRRAPWSGFDKVMGPKLDASVYKPIWIHEALNTNRISSPGHHINQT